MLNSSKKCWTTALLDGVADRGSGHTPSKSHPEYWNGGIKWVSLTDSDKLDCPNLLETSKEISEAGLANSSAVLHPRGSVIMSRDADVGKCAVLGTDMAVSQHFLTWECSAKGQLHNYFLYYWLQNRKAEFERIAAGSTIKTIGLPYFKKLKISYPSLHEQRQIAGLLRTWDEAIELCERLREEKIKRLTWFRTHLFTGKVRLKGFSEPWKIVSLAEVLTEHGMRSSGAEQVFSVSVHKGLINQIEHLGRSFAAKDTSHYNRVLPGDIVYTKSPTGEFPLGIIKQSTVAHDVIVSPLYGVFTPVTYELGLILDAYFRSPVTVRNYLAPLIQKGAKNTIAITNSRFLEGKLHLPLDPEEQSAIARIVKDAGSEIAVLNRQLRALQHQKMGLMRKLLAGDWRVPSEAEDAA
jgi:type I restriction enzyme S subunit